MALHTVIHVHPYVSSYLALDLGCFLFESKEFMIVFINENREKVLPLVHLAFNFIESFQDLSWLKLEML